MITTEAKEKELYIRRMHFTSFAREGCLHLLNICKEYGAYLLEDCAHTLSDLEIIVSALKKNKFWSRTRGV